MKKYLLIAVLHIFSSCNSQETPKITNTEKIELQEFFGVKANVKEIDTEVEASTTMGKKKYRAITSFYNNGAPKDTKNYEDGKYQNTEPWRVSNKEDEKGWELKKELDDKKRVIKATKYNSGKVVSETHYKYDSAGNKIEEFDKIGNTKKSFNYNKLGKVSEEIEYQPNNIDWYSKKKYSYDNKLNLVETQVYYYPDDKIPNGKIIYTYDANGSLTKSITYDKSGSVIEKKIRKISYY